MVATGVKRGWHDWWLLLGIEDWREPHSHTEARYLSGQSRIARQFRRVKCSREDDHAGDGECLQEDEGVLVDARYALHTVFVDP